MTTLLVTQFSGGAGEFRRPAVRRVYRLYLDRYRRAVVAAATRLARDGHVTVLTAREIVDASMLPPAVTLRYADEQAYRVHYADFGGLTETLAGGWWPMPDEEPELMHAGVWLPDVLSTYREILVRLEIVEPLGIVLTAIEDVRPARVALLSGASTPERLAALVARRDGLAVSTASPRAFWMRGYGLALGKLRQREERLQLGYALRWPRRPFGRDERTGPETSSARVLLVTCRPRHHYVVDPLAAALRAAGALSHVVSLPHPSHEKEMSARMRALARDGVSARDVTDYVPAAEAARVARRYRRLGRDLWRRLNARGQLDACLTWERLALGRLVRPFVRDAVCQTLVTAAVYAEAAVRALDALQPRGVVITANRRFPERALALAARERGIPSLLFSGSLVAGRGDETIAIADVSDRLLVIGDHLRARLVTDGMDPDRVTVVGDPRSNAARMIPRARLVAEVRADFGLPADRPLVLMLSKYVSSLFSAAEKAAFYRTVFAAAAELGQPSVIVKVHPNEELPLLRRQIVEWGCPDAVLTQEYDVHRLFGAADVTVMVTSMGGLEAMAMGCPVVAVQTPGKSFEGEHMPPYVSERAVERVDAGDGSGLARVITRLISDPVARESLVARGQKFAERYVHPVDGQLGRRVLSVIDEVAAARARSRA